MPQAVNRGPSDLHFSMSVNGEWLEDAVGLAVDVQPVTPPMVRPPDDLVLRELKYHPNGRAWSWLGGRVLIEPAFNKDGKALDRERVRALGCPRMTIGRPEAFQAVADWMVALGVITICGPILSGAQMAFAVALFSNGGLIPTYLSKKGYETTRHSSRTYVEESYAIIDDVVSSGETLETALKETMGRTERYPTVIVANTWTYDLRNLGFLNPIRDRLYIVSM